MSNRVKPRAPLSGRTQRVDIAARQTRNRRLALRLGGVALAVVAAIVVLVVVTRKPADTANPSTPSYEAVAPGCRWIDIPAEGRSSKMTDVGKPQGGMPPSAGTATMTITTNVGVITVRLDPTGAPCTVASFAYLASRKYFAGTSCHRLVTQGIYVLQCGDPSGTGEGGPGYSFPDENLGATSGAYAAGTVAMANAGPDTNGSQFFIVYRDSPLEPKYTPFGTVSAGLDLVRSVAAGGTADGSGDGHPKVPVAIQSLTVT
jgi:peptidyl-prolyl cis-trans isomerase B (cyclophilin B)